MAKKVNYFKEASTEMIAGAPDHRLFVPVEIQLAQSGDAEILRNLLDLYAHDFTEYHYSDIGENGRFAYKSLPQYWNDPNRHPFLIRVAGKLAGLAFVKKGSDISGLTTVWDMAEFFVLRGYRRNGIGTLAAHEVWRRFPGSWEVRVTQANPAACLFWERAITAFTCEPTQAIRFYKDERCWQLFSFASSLVGTAI